MLETSQDFGRWSERASRHGIALARNPVPAREDLLMLAYSRPLFADCTLPALFYLVSRMTNVTSLTSEQLIEAAKLKEQIAKLETRLTAILGSSSASDHAPTGRRTMSKAARAKIAAAQRARWAKAKRKSATRPAKRKKRTLSPAAKAKISAAAKARWAKAKAAGKKSL